MPIQLVPSELIEFLAALSDRFPSKMPFRLCYLWGHGEMLPVVEGGELQRHGGYSPEDGCAIVMGVNPECWDELRTADGSLYFKSREAAIDYAKECIAHEYAHHLQHERGTLPYDPTEKSEAEAEEMASEMIRALDK